jgi:GT2 family glycosyltransferase
MPKLTCSLVLYNNEPSIFESAIISFLNSCNGSIYIVDNSPKAIKSNLFNFPRVFYFHSPSNLGFGSAHNFAFSKALTDSDYHLIMNPDVSFESDVIEQLVCFMLNNSDVGVVMPRILYPDGKEQFLAKLLPTPFNLIIRRFIPIYFIRNYFDKKYELRDYDSRISYDIPSLSGCFLLCRTKLLKSAGGFDDNFFMYMEDVDLVRRLGDFSKTVFLPRVSIIHHYAKGSYRNLKLLKYHILSAILYFNKWGWIFDKVRISRNSKVRFPNNLNAR